MKLKGVNIYETGREIKALDAALVKIEKDYGKGSVMKLGEYQADRTIEVTPTGSISLISH